MAELFSQYLEQAPVDRRWLWALRIATLVLLATSSAFSVQFLLPVKDFNAWYAFALLTPLSFLYVLLDLRRNPPEKFGLALATAWGALLGAVMAGEGVLFTAEFVSTIRKHGFWSESWPTYGMAIQVLVILSVAVAFIQRARKRNWSPWLWAVRILAAGSILCAGLAVHASVRNLLRFGVLDWERVVVLAGVALAYGSVLWGLRRSEDETQARQALFVAATVGVVTVALYIGSDALGLKFATDSAGLLTENAILNMLVFWGLAVVFSTYAGLAIRIYYLLKREPGDRLRLLGGFAVVILVGLTLSAATSEKIRRQHPRMHNSASAAASLRTINTAQITYASTYNHGYSTTLAALGPGPEGAPPSESAAGLIDEVLATGKKSGYTFVYAPGERDQKGEIWTYTVCARPLPSNGGSRMSFFTDESGVIRGTHEDRCAAAEDPPLAG